jgi:hypothetical protein
MSDTCAQKVTKILVKLVHPADAPAAQASAWAMAKFGIALLIFSNRESMNGWLAGARAIRGLSVRVLKDLEVDNA